MAEFYWSVTPCQHYHIRLSSFYQFSQLQYFMFKSEFRRECRLRMGDFNNQKGREHPTGSTEPCPLRMVDFKECQS